MSEVNKPIAESRRKYVEWSVLCAAIWISFLIGTILVSALTVVFNIPIPSSEGTTASLLMDVVDELPIFGDLAPIFGHFPGESSYGTISYLIAAIPFAIAIRNLSFVFENMRPCQEMEGENGSHNLIVAVSIPVFVFLLVTIFTSLLFLIHS